VSLGLTLSQTFSQMRRLVRIPVLLAWSVACCSALAFAVRRHRADAAHLRAYRTHLWARGACRILGLRLRVRGNMRNRLRGRVWGKKPANRLAADSHAPHSQGDLSEPGNLWVANHLSYLDIVVLAALGPVQFVSKSEVAEWPGLGVLARMNGSLFLSRTRPRDALRVSEAIEASLASGLSVVVFPEGTSSDGRTLLPFKPALLDSAARGAYPVLPMALRYHSHHADAENDLCWHGDRDFVPHFWKVLGLPGFVATVHAAPVPLVGRDRGALSNCAYDSIAALGRYLSSRSRRRKYPANQALGLKPSPANRISFGDEVLCRPKLPN
jgi:1-acyl-sn-glycerol-3-phosphate acyltransferase